MSFGLLATDLDGTLFGKNRKTQNTDCLFEISQILKNRKMKLAFVTGRHLDLVPQAIKDFSLPLPNAIVCSVGTEIYLSQNWELDREYEQALERKNPPFDPVKITVALAPVQWLQEQEPEKQGRFKKSYYSRNMKKEQVVSKAKEALDSNSINARIVFSVDRETGKGLVDVLPQNASKHSAIRFLAEKWGIPSKSVIVAGDSGNDIEMVCSEFNSIVVGNASELLVSEAKKSKKAFFSKKPAACGVLEGLKHYLEEK